MQPESARTMGKWSIGISVANIVIGFIIIILIIVMYVAVVVETLNEISAAQNTTMSFVSIGLLMLIIPMK
jgi:hypothetical protein